MYPKLGTFKATRTQNTTAKTRPTGAWGETEADTSGLGPVGKESGVNLFVTTPN